MSGLISPDVNNISVGTGYIEFKPSGAVDYFHLGNVPRFSFSVQNETLDHHVPVNGIKVKDYSWVIGQTAEIEMDMEEITARNLQLLMLGDVTTVDGVTRVSIAPRNGRSGALKYTATNEVGPRWHIDLWSITFSDGGQYDPIASDNFNKISIKAAVLMVDGVYGEMTLL